VGYRDYQGKVSPPWLRGPFGAAWARASGDTRDELVDRLKLAVKARMPDYAPPDAMQLIGAERGVERLPGDTDEEYASRVRNVWEMRRWAGTPFGLLLALADIGYPAARLMIHRGRDYYLDAGALETCLMDSERWVMDARESFWSQFQVLLPAPHPWATSVDLDPSTDGTATLTPGGTPDAPWVVEVFCTTGGTVASGLARLTVTVGGSADYDIPVPAHGIVSFNNIGLGFASGVECTIEGTLVAGDSWAWTSGVFPDQASQDVERLRRVIRRWKPAFATCRGIVVQTAGDLFGFRHRTFGTAGALGESASHNRVIWSA